MNFFSITKPGIIFGNIITVLGGFFLGMQGHIDVALLVLTLLGMSLVVASGCVFNNYIDRDIDQLMERTKLRALATGKISIINALLYAIFLGILGFVTLACVTNLLTVLLAATGLFFYVVVYSLAMKRHSAYGTLIGGISGAIPPVVGYCAVTNRFDLAAVLLFFILFLWQMPHFLAISIYRLQDYKAASIPILPLVKNIHYTKISILVYIFAFTVVSILPTVYGYTGYAYLVMALILGLMWLGLGLRGFKTEDDSHWARKMFLFSIINITFLCLAMSMKNL